MSAVSIHATRVGGDKCTYCTAKAPDCFYPRHPCGWRLVKDPELKTTNSGFYPRHPCGWRRGASGAFFGRGWVSIHATRVGGDCVKLATFRCIAVSIHATRVGGDFVLLVLPAGGNVSIHATRVGGDPPHPATWAGHGLFLSTPPVWVATDMPRLPDAEPTVSIHATRVGGDDR